MNSMLGGVTANWIPNQAIRHKVMDATWSYRESLLGVQDLILSSHRTIRFLAVSSHPVPLGGYGTPMLLRQDQNRTKMVDSVKKTHMHISEVRQIPPPVTELGFRPSEYHMLSTRFPPSVPHMFNPAAPNQIPANRGGCTAGIPMSSLNNVRPTYPPPRPDFMCGPLTDASILNHGMENENRGMWLGFPRTTQYNMLTNQGVQVENHGTVHSNSIISDTHNRPSVVSEVSHLDYNHWNTPRVIIPDSLQENTEMFPSVVQNMDSSSCMYPPLPDSQSNSLFFSTSSEQRESLVVKCNESISECVENGAQTDDVSTEGAEDEDDRVMVGTVQSGR